MRVEFTVAADSRRRGLKIFGGAPTTYFGGGAAAAPLALVHRATCALLYCARFHAELSRVQLFEASFDCMKLLVKEVTTHHLLKLTVCHSSTHSIDWTDS